MRPLAFQNFTQFIRSGYKNQGIFPEYCGVFGGCLAKSIHTKDFGQSEAEIWPWY